MKHYLRIRKKRNLGSNLSGLALSSITKNFHLLFSSEDNLFFREFTFVIINGMYHWLRSNLSFGVGHWLIHCGTANASSPSLEVGGGPSVRGYEVTGT